MAIDHLPPLRDVITRYGLQAQRALGQNFLLDLNLTSRIARLAGDLSTHTVIEIGPGPGGLTRALLAAQAQKVIVIERDARCLPALEDISSAYPGRLEIIEADALTIDLTQFENQAPFKIISNLPYNIGTALLMKWIDAPVWPPLFNELILMFQKEVAERIVATPETPHDYGRLSVFCGWRTDAKIMFDLSPKAFTPPPKVTSAVVRLVPRPSPLPCRADLLARVTQSAFGQRRKMLRQSLKSLGHDPLALLEATGIEPTARAETLKVEDFVRLANEYERRSRPIQP